jgi:hypothetical protein
VNTSRAGQMSGVRVRRPAEIAPLLGDWWVEGERLVSSYRNGRLEVDPVAGTPGRTRSVLAREGPDRFRVVEGRERGEQLRVSRDEQGEVVKLYFATYAVTRRPKVFGP